MDRFYNVLFFYVIPIVTPILVYLTIITFPSIRMILLAGDDFLGGFWLFVFAPIHFVISVIVTVFLYGVSHIEKWIKSRGS